MHNNSISCPRVSAALIQSEGKILIARRPAHKAFGLFWEFPGGKAEPGESLQDCLRREIREELALEIIVDRLFHHVRLRTPALSIDLYAFWCRLCGGEPDLREHVEYRWVHPVELKRYRFTEADEEVVVLLERLTEPADRRGRPGSVPSTSGSPH